MESVVLLIVEEKTAVMMDVEVAVVYVAMEYVLLQVYVIVFLIALIKYAVMMDAEVAVYLVVLRQIYVMELDNVYALDNVLEKNAVMTDAEVAVVCVQLEIFVLMGNASATLIALIKYVVLMDAVVCVEIVHLDKLV